MSEQPSYKAFFGDKEREFKFTWPLLVELEKLTGVGIGALIERVIQRRFSVADIAEIIRLGLVGAGEDTKRAAELVAAYVHNWPLERNAILAIELVSFIWAGPAEKETEQ